MIRSSAAAAIVALFTLLGATPALAGDGPDGVCRTDRYFVHVPTFADASVVPDRFGRKLKQALQPHIPQDRTGPSYTIKSIKRVLPGRRIDQRSDGARRFWQVRLDRELTPAEACLFLDTLRIEVYGLLAEPRAYVGRECTAVGHGAPADPFSPDWHLQVTGVPGPLSVGAEPAPVAMVDTGFAAPADYVADPGFDEDYHRHGTAMADLVGQVDGEIPVLDYRALDSDGMGDLADVARAVDAAVFQAEGPRVINLSLGWPPELERTRQFSAGGCDTWEDPAGEAVRYALVMARMRDAGLLTLGGLPWNRNGPTAVVAAAGNRVTPFGINSSFFFEKMLDVMDEVPNLDPCSEPADDDLFYPAQWSQRQTCMSIAGIDYTFSRMTIAVGATDHHDNAAGTSLLVPMPPLVAPGTNVLAAGLRWTGSSVSTALVSAALARAFGEGAVSSDVAFLAVHGAAEPVPHIGNLTRRLAFSQPYVAAPAPPLQDHATLVDGAEAEPWSTFDQTVCLLVLIEWTHDDADFQAVIDHCPPFLHNLDQFSAGRAGPQPPDAGCPDCPAKLFDQSDLVDLDIALNDTWDPATAITKPYLYAEWPDGAYVWMPLPDNIQTWEPGAQFTIKGLTLEHPDGTLSLGDLEAGGKMQLQLQVQTPKQNAPTTDVSDLTMKLN